MRGPGIAHTGRILRIAALSLGILVALIAGAAIALDTAAGKRLLLARLASGLAAQNIALETDGIAGSLWGRLTIGRISLSDEGGPFASAEGLVFEWHPLQLFAGELAIETLTAEHIALERLPPTAGTDDTGSYEGPLLSEPPLDVRVEHFAIDRLEIGTALAGEAAALTVSGNAAISSPALLKLSLDAERLDGVAALAKLDVEFDAVGGQLRLDGNLAEPEGGLIATALGLEGAPPLSATLAGEGPLKDWAGRFAFDGGSGLQAALDITIAGERPYHIALAGDATLADLVPEEWRFLASPALTLDAVVALEEDGGVQIERFLAESEAVSARLSGSISTGHELALDFAFETRNTAGWQTALAPASFDAARIEAEISGTLEAPQIATIVRIDAPAFDNERAAALDLHGTIDIDDARIGFDLTGRLFDFSPSDAAIAASASGEPILSASGSWNRDTGGVAFDTAVLDVGSVRLEADGGIDLEPLAANFALDGDLRDLAALAPFVGLDLAGRAALQAHVSADALGFAGIVTLDGQGVSLGDPLLEGLLGGDPSLAATLSMQPDGTAWSLLEIADFSLDAPGLVLDGNATLDLEAATIDGNYALRLPHLAMLDPALAGSLDAEGRISGALGDPLLSMNGDVAGLAFDGRPLGRYRFDAAIENPASAIMATIAASGASPAGPLDLHLVATPREAGIELAPLRLAIGDHTRLDGRLIWRSDSGIAEGGLGLRIDRLAPYGALADAALAGALEGRIELSGEGGRQRIALDGNLVSPSMYGIAADRMSLDAVAILRGDVSTLSLAIEANAIVAGPVGLDTLTLSAEGTLADLAGEVAAHGDYASGDYEGPLDLGASFQLAIDDGSTRLTIARLEGQFTGEPVALERPSVVTSVDGRFVLDGLALAIGPAHLAGRMEQDAGNVAADLALTGMPASWLGGLGGIDEAVGTIDATLHMAGTPAAPTATLDVAIEGLAMRAPRFRDETAMSATIAARYADGRFDVVSGWTGLGNQPLAIEISMPLQFQLVPFTANMPPAGALSGVARWKGDARLLFAVAPIDPHRIAGPLTLDLVLGGTVQAPQVTGSLALAGGEYENFVTGTLLRDLDIDLSASGRNGLHFTLHGTDGDKGNVSAEGTLEFDPARDIPFDVNATFAIAVLVRRDEAKARASGAVHLAGTMAGATLTGDIVVDRFDGRLDAGLPPHVTKLDVIEINGPEGEIEQPERDEPVAPFALDLDVGVAIPSRAYLRGRGLDSEWYGNLRITGDANAPRIVGNLQPRRGTFTFANRVFDVADSEIVFDGSPDIDPALDISATGDAGGLTAIIRVTGRASDPVIAITSRPPLPQEEVLARILFGRKGGELSPVQALQLAQVLSSLSGRGPSTGIVDVVRQTLGVDMLAVSGGDDDGEGPGVQIGEYLTDDVRVGVEQGFTTGTTAGTVEIELTDELSLETRVEQGRSRVGITWGYDY